VITIERSGRDSGFAGRANATLARNFTGVTTFDRNQCGFPATIVGGYVAGRVLFTWIRHRRAVPIKSSAVVS